MPEYLAPGVYVEETSFRSKSIEGVSTTTAGFVGPCRYGPLDIEPDVLTSVTDFENVYGDRQKLGFNGGQEEIDNHLWHAVRAFFAEGGKRLYVEYHSLSLREMYLLGMTIRFVLWRGIQLKPVYQLTGYTPVPLDHEPSEKITAIDLNQALIDLLQAKGAGTWHIPTALEIQAEASIEASRAMEGADPEPPDDFLVQE